jgi:hypothetical protein
MPEYFQISVKSEYNYPVKNYINNNWENDSFVYMKFYGLRKSDESHVKYRIVEEKFRIKSQNNKFKDSKLTKIKIPKPLNNKGVWLGNGGDEHMYGLYVKKEIGDKVFSKYPEFIKMIPLVYGKDEELQGYMIVPYFGFEQLKDLNMNESDIEYTYEKHLAGEKSGNYWHPKYVYQTNKLKNKPPIFNYRLYNDDYGLTSSLSHLLFNEEVAKELHKVGVKVVEVETSDY